MTIRRATDADAAAIWRIFQAVVRPGDTYSFSADTTERDAVAYFLGPGITSFVAEDDGRVIGMYKLIPNCIGRGSHVANASFMVDPDAQGRGAGRSARRALPRLRQGASGYEAMQFNFVVSTNTAGVASMEEAWLRNRRYAAKEHSVTQRWAMLTRT